MGKHHSRNNNDRSSERGYFMQIYRDLLCSPAWACAWACLSSAGIKAYLAIGSQRRKSNNGDLSLPLSLSKHHGIKSSATLARAKRELTALGLIAETRKGVHTENGQRLPTLYRLTEFEAYANPRKHIEASQATHDWKKIKSIAHGKSLIKKAQQESSERFQKRKSNMKSHLN